MEDLERVPPYRFREGYPPARADSWIVFGDPELDSFTLSPSLHVQVPSRAPTHASFGLRLTAFPSGAEATMGAVRQDEYDQCLPTVTAVTCTRISRASRGVSCPRPLRTVRLASPCLGTERLDPREYEAFHDAIPASVHPADFWPAKNVTSVTPVVEPGDSRFPPGHHDQERRAL